MNIILDAWLERVDAYVRILDRSSGNELLRWNKQQLNSAIENGNICCADLKQREISDEELLSLVAGLGS